MSRKVIGCVAVLAAAAIAMMALTQGTESIDVAGKPAPQELLGWDEVVGDAWHSGSEPRSQILTAPACSTPASGCTR